MIHSTPLNTAYEAKNRIIFLDGIRGWASFAVILSHTIACFLSPSTPLLNYYGEFGKQRLLNDIAYKNYLDIFCGIISRLITDGHLAVLIFFVLTGYALSASHLNQKKQNLALATTARYFRLMIPILFTSLIAYLLLKFGLFFNLEVATTPEKSLRWLGTFYKFDANFFEMLKFSLFDVFFKYNDETTYNATLWTMSIEIIGSFFIYSYLGIFRSTERIYWRLTVCALLALMLFSPYFACFLSGHVIAELNKKYLTNHLIYKRHIQIALLFVFLITAILSTVFRGDERVTFAIATTLVFVTSFSVILKKIFSTKISEYMGKISFPLYLIQIPVICSLSSYLYNALPTLGFSVFESNLINLIITIIVCLLASALLLPIEKLSILYSKKIGDLFLNN